MLVLTHPPAVHDLFCPYQGMMFPLKEICPALISGISHSSCMGDFSADKCEKTMQKFMNPVKHIFPFMRLERKNVSRITLNVDVLFRERVLFFSFDGSYMSKNIQSDILLF